MVCHGSDCKRGGARDIYCAAKQCTRQLGCNKATQIVRTRCLGFCKHGPIVCHQPSNTWLTDTDPQKVCEMLREKLEGPA